MSKKILITGGTGSLGSRLAKRLLEIDKSNTVIVFSRDEQKQYKMRLQYEDLGYNIEFVIGNIQIEDSISSAIRIHKPDIVIHTAAQKHVRICDENPAQTVSTNILGTDNVINACIEHGIKIGCFVSTDKATAPTTLYGMTKAVAERLVVNAGMRQKNTQFIGARYGNIVSSEGSLIPLYQSIAASDHKVFKVTHKDMTRFFMTFDMAVDLTLAMIKIPSDNLVQVHSCIDNTFIIPKLPAAKILDIAELFAESCGGTVEMTHPYPSEKFHEALTEGYTSNNHLISKEELKKLLVQEGLL